MKFRCPRCGATTLIVEVVAEALLTHENGEVSLEIQTDENGKNVQFSNRSVMRCPSCLLKREAAAFLLFTVEAGEGV